MDKLKAFLASDTVKAIAAVIAVVVPAVAAALPESTRNTVLWVWGSILTPVLVAFGILSGGTSNLNSNASKIRAGDLPAPKA